MFVRSFVIEGLFVILSVRLFVIEGLFVILRVSFVRY